MFGTHKVIYDFKTEMQLFLQKKVVSYLTSILKIRHFHFFASKLGVEYSIEHSDVRVADMQKPILEPKRYDKIGHFSYRTR